MAYRFTPTTHNDPTFTAATFAELMAKVRAKMPDATIKTNDYGEGWIKSAGRVVGYVDQGPLIRD